jgi:hypothetical protein
MYTHQYIPNTKYHCTYNIIVDMDQIIILKMVSLNMADFVAPVGPPSHLLALRVEILG